MAFSVLGITRGGEILQVSIAGDPQKLKEATLSDAAQILKSLGAEDAMVLGTSQDVQQYVRGTHLVEANARTGSDTGEHFKKQAGRPLSTIIYGLIPKQQTDDIPAYHDPYGFLSPIQQHAVYLEVDAGA
jgi:hypothetical protein